MLLESPVMREQGSAQPRRGRSNDTHEGLWRGPRAPVPRGPFIWNLPATRQKGLEDPARPISRLRPFGPPLCCLTSPRPGLGITEDTAPTGLGSVEHHPRLTPRMHSWGCRAAPWGLGEVEIDGAPDRACN